MRIADINGVYRADSIEELDAILMKRCGDFNSFWLSHDDDAYPMLSLLVKNDLATLTYFPREFDAGFSSVGTVSELDREASTVFAISHNRADDLVVLNSAVLPFSTAVLVAREFFRAKDLPTAVEWREL